MSLRGLDQRLSARSPLLVLADPLDRRRDALCSDVLVDSEDGPVLVFAYHRRPHRLVERLRETGEESPEGTIIVLGDGTGDRSSGDPDPGVTVESCSAANLTQVGVAVSEALDAHDDQLCACLGSVTTLLQYVDVRTAFNFLHVLTSKLEGTDSHVHAHLDPGALDDETVAAIQPLFDAAIERSEDGWTPAE